MFSGKINCVSGISGKDSRIGFRIREVPQGARRNTGNTENALFLQFYFAAKNELPRYGHEPCSGTAHPLAEHAEPGFCCLHSYDVMFDGMFSEAEGATPALMQVSRHRPANAGQRVCTEIQPSAPVPELFHPAGRGKNILNDSTASGGKLLQGNRFSVQLNVFQFCICRKISGVHRVELNSFRLDKIIRKRFAVLGIRRRKQMCFPINCDGKGTISLLRFPVNPDAAPPLQREDLV